jgi:hypothetical protein
LELAVRFGYAAMLVGVVVLLPSRLRLSTAPKRRMLAPVLVASILYAGAPRSISLCSRVRRP